MVRVEYSKVDRDVAESNLSFHLRSLSLNGLGLKGYRESVYNLYLNRYVAMLKARPVATEDSSEVTLELQDNSNAELVGKEKEFSFLSSITNSMEKDINISISDEEEEDLFEKELQSGVSSISPSRLVNRKELSTSDEGEISVKEDVEKPQTPTIDLMLAYSVVGSSTDDDDDEIDYGDDEEGDDEIDYGDDEEEDYDEDGEGGEEDEDGGEEDEIDYGDEDEDEIDYGDEEEDDYDETGESTSPNQEAESDENEVDELEFDLDEDELLEEKPTTPTTPKPVDVMVSRPSPIARPRGSFSPIRRQLHRDVGINTNPVRSSTPTKVTSSVGSKGNPIPKPKSKDFDRGSVKERGSLNPLDFDMTSLESLLEDFDSSKIVKDVTKPKPSKFQPKGVSRISYEKGMSLREFLRANPRCPIETAEKYFKKAEIKKELQMGRVMKKGNILFI